MQPVAVVVNRNLFLSSFSEYGLGVRHLQTLLFFLALTCAYAQRVNLSVAVVAMTDASAANPDFPVSTNKYCCIYQLATYLYRSLLAGI